MLWLLLKDRVCERERAREGRRSRVSSLSAEGVATLICGMSVLRLLDKGYSTWWAGHKFVTVSAAHANVSDCPSHCASVPLSACPAFQMPNE